MDKRKGIIKLIVVIAAVAINILMITKTSADTTTAQIEKYASVVIFDIVIGIFLLRWDSIMDIPVGVWNDRKLIYKLGRNDFKTKFAGSIFGTVWAFIQPIVTVFVYWFVFEKALNAGTQSTKAGIQVPYVLWLLCGLVPWFFFSDALPSGTNVLVEYSYLVKKVVFNISNLPIVKLISSLFVHLFFIAFTIAMFAFYGYYPNLYSLQVIYYSAALIVLLLGLIYFTSAIVVFFRDLSQIIGILLQVGVWFTPIMWNIDAVAMSPILLFILKLNPLYYITSGYRDALINEIWFWEKPNATLYFWALTLIIFVLGTTVFKRLKVHFADVL